MDINSVLKKYIEDTIFPSYSKNDLGHNLSHIKYVIDRSLKFASTFTDINLDMVYTIASYHDIGHFIDAKNHERVSADILFNDKNLNKFFNANEIKIMMEAIEDHRASLEYEPRSIYGKIVSSADRNTDINSVLKRTYEYRIKNFKCANLDEVINESFNHIKEKFGKKGYAIEKMYFEDNEYKKFLLEIEELINNKEKFIKKYKQVNNINNG